MANYIGNEPFYQSNLRDYFAGTGSQTVYTLTHLPGGANGIIVAISGVIQKPSVSYYVSAKTLTFTEAPPIPALGEVNNIEIIYLQKLGAVYGANWKVPVGDNIGTTDALVANFNPVFPALVDNMLAYVVVPSANLTTTPTISVDGLPAKTIVSADGSAVFIGALKGTVLLRYESSSDKWVLVGGATGFGVTERGALSGSSVTPSISNYGSFSWNLTSNSTVNFPSNVPQSGAWYIDITVDNTGGYALTFGPGFNKIYGFYFDCLPNAVYRLWMIARGSSTMDVNVERLV